MKIQKGWDGPLSELESSIECMSFMRVVGQVFLFCQYNFMFTPLYFFVTAELISILPFI